jgi:hypothetical protein
MRMELWMTISWSRVPAQAVVYHFALYEQTMVASSQAIRGRNEYATQYAAAAMSDIRRRFAIIVTK